MPGDRRKRILIAVLFLISAAAGIAVAEFLTNSVPVDGPVSIVAPDGPNATIQGQADVNLTDPWPDAHTVELNTSEGNITFVSDGPSNLSIQAAEINGTWTNVSDLDVSTNQLQIDPEDKPPANVSDDATAFGYRTGVAVDDSTVDFTYNSPGGTADVTLRQLPASTDIAAVDADTNDILAVASSDGSGTATFSNLDSGDRDVELHTSSGGPTLSNPSPEGQISTEPSQISIDVNDSDFPNDDVEVEFTLDGSVIETKNTTANGTVSTSAFGELDLGEHSVSVDVVDAYGQTASDSWTFELPENVTIRAESPPHETLTGCGAEVTFYEDETEDPFIVNRTDTDGDGNISLAGLPAQSQFAAALTCEGYHNRTVLIDSIFDQQTVFMINTSETTVENRFTITDNTNRFPADSSEIVIQKAINRTIYDSSLSGNNFEWLNVAGDDIGADQAFTTDLIEDDRYRIRVQNDDGDQRILGAYTPTTTGTIDLTVGALDVIYTDENDNIDWAFNQTNESGTEILTFTYSDPQDLTTAVDVLIYERGNASNVIEDSTHTSGPYGNLTITVDLSVIGETGKNWVVEFNATRDGEFIAGKGFTNPAVTIQLPNLDEDWRHILAVIALIMVGAVFSQANADIGAIAVAGMAGIFWTTGFLSGVTSGAAIAVAIGLALFYKWATREPVT